MCTPRLFALLLFAVAGASAQPAANYRIETVAGKLDLGDGGSANQLLLAFPRGMTFDSDGNLYIADQSNNIVWRVTPDGVAARIAGNIVTESTGSGGPARNARLNFPPDVAADGAGNVYVVESVGNSVRRINPQGEIEDFAGTGEAGFGGDGGPATQAQLSFPSGVAAAADGTVYIADTGNNRIRCVAPDGTITTLAGDGRRGSEGDGGPAAAASLAGPNGIAADNAGNVLIADTGNFKIRRVNLNGGIETIAGNGTPGFGGDGGPATQASLASPEGVAPGPDGTVLIADSGNNRIREIRNGMINTIAGRGGFGFSGDGGQAIGAQFDRGRKHFRRDPEPPPSTADAHEPVGNDRGHH